ncbi:MAG: hypothetical protein ACI9OJ_002576 [Myxococcota bacterium]
MPSIDPDRDPRAGADGRHCLTPTSQKKPPSFRVIPSGRLVLMMAGPILMSAAAVFVPSLVWPALAMDLGIALFAVADAWLVRGAAVDVARTVPEILSVGRPNSVDVWLENQGGRSLTVGVNIDLFDSAHCSDLPLEIAVGPGESHEVQIGVTPTSRGRYELGAFTVRYPSPLGLWTRQLTIDATSVVQVYPDVQAVTAYELLAKQNRDRAMLRRTPQRGGESEFDSLREYRRGDEYRSIDWRATARRQTLVSRQYRLEQDQNIFFLLDAGRLMTAETEQLSYFDHALNAALLLGHVAAGAGDRIGAATFSNEIKNFTAPTAGSTAVGRLVRSMYATYPDRVEPDFERAFRELGTRIRRRSLVVLFTQVADDVTAKNMLRVSRIFLRRHLLLCVMFRDTDVENLAYSHGGAEPETRFIRAAAAQSLAERAKLMGALEQAGALVLDVSAAELTPALIDRYLEVKSRRLL